MIESKYKYFLWIIGAEFVLLVVLNKCGVSIEHLGARIIGLFLVIVPIEFIMFKLGKDERHSEKNVFSLNWFFGGLLSAVLAVLLQYFFCKIEEKVQ